MLLVEEGSLLEKFCSNAMQKSMFITRYQGEREKQSLQCKLFGNFAAVLLTHAFGLATTIFHS